MNDKEINKLKKYLALQLEKYVLLIKEEHREFIPEHTLDFLNNITDYEELIKIEDTGTITCFVNNGKIYFPILAYKVLNALKKIPGFGFNQTHKTYNDDNLIINDNTFNTYIVHAFLKGLSAKEFYDEMMLHEAMHLCGMAGANAFQEGLTEFKTRELAKKYNLKTSACGYPKEVKIVYRLQEVFGSDFMNKLAFDMSSRDQFMIIFDKLGKDGVDFFSEIISLMEKEFQTKYYQHMKSFNGLTAPFKKAKMYNEIDYTEVYKVIDAYCSSHKITDKEFFSKAN